MSQWNNGKLEFSAAFDAKHVILLFTHTQGRQMKFTLIPKNRISTVYTNCPATPGAPLKHHEYIVLDSAESYQLEIKYDDFDCGNTGTLNKSPENNIKFGGAFPNTAYEVEQWLFSDAAGLPLCGITIIVIDDIVGPDGSGKVHPSADTKEQPEDYTG